MVTGTDGTDNFAIKNPHINITKYNFTGLASCATFILVEWTVYIG
jgi:hypothetical protein